MFIILGATGHVGGAVADALLADCEDVTVVTRDADKAAAWQARGATVAEADVCDAAALREVLRRGRRAFLLNPPGDVRGDGDAAELSTGAAIAEALAGSGLEMAVAVSTYGAQDCRGCGDLGTLHAFEQALAAQDVPVTIQRGAYYMSNWDAQLPAIRDEGVLRTMFPADMALPMVAPGDLGLSAARLLREAPRGLQMVEGPARYSSADAAASFARALGREVRVEETPREGWADAYRALGFSDGSAASFARMTALTVDQPFPPVAEVTRGATTLDAYVEALVARG